MLITQSELKSILHYNPKTGIFTRTINSGSQWRVGGIAGCKHKSGYIILQLSLPIKRNYRAHRLAWLYVYGYFPEEIDHVNHKRNDNRIENLREVDRVTNSRNHSLKSTNSSGFTGVGWDKSKKRWQSRIVVGGKTIFLGRFADIKDAVSAREKANIKYGFHENHGRENKRYFNH